MAKWDATDLDIRSKSVEQTLFPLVTQITTLVNHKASGRRSAKAQAAIQEVGRTLHNAVIRFGNVGEQIAQENEDVAVEMRAACAEAKQAGQTISELTKSVIFNDTDDGVKPTDKGDLVRSARSLLSAVTQVLVIADSVMVKRLLAAVKKVDDRLKELETVNSFTDFVQAFSQFGADMVELAHLSGDRQNDLKDDILKAEMCAARSILEKSTMMLLTTSKTCLRHPDSLSARGNRQGVLKKMREAMETIQSVAQDGHTAEDNEEQSFVVDLNDFESALESLQESSPGDSELKIQFQKAFEKVLLDIHTVVDSPHMRKDKRADIMALCENAQDLMKDILDKYNKNIKNDNSSGDSLQLAVQRISKNSKELQQEVHRVATDQVFETFSHLGHKKSLPALRNAAASGDIGSVENLANVFLQDAKRLVEVSRVARSMSTNPALALTAKKVDGNIQTLCPQVIEAARTLATHPVSRIAQENMEVFVDVWEMQVDELGKILRGITAGGDVSKNLPSPREKERLTSVSMLGRILERKSSSGSQGDNQNLDEKGEPLEKAAVDSKEQEKICKLISNVNLMTSQLQLHHFEDSDGDIVNRAREMSDMVNTMYFFTRGEGPLQSTEELFQAAQEFAEAGRAFHRVSRKYASKAEDSAVKKELLGYVDRIPANCQQLTFLSRSLAVGQAACCRKVWGVMHLTKNIIKIVARVVNSCYLLAERYSPLKLPPDQRLWQIDESIFSDVSSFTSLSRRSSLKSLENSDTEQEIPFRARLGSCDEPVFKTEL